MSLMKGQIVRESDEIRKEMIYFSESGFHYDEALKTSVAHAESEVRDLRMNALHCFGYIARVYGKLDLETVLPLLRKAEVDPDIWVSAAARDALDDIGTFLPNLET